MLKIENLSVSVAGKPILHDVNLEIKPGQVHALFGPNGSGKSTLVGAIMGFPRFQITGGKSGSRESISRRRRFMNGRGPGSAS